eukprot:268217-Prymnesium_polylepis.1
MRRAERKAASRSAGACERERRAHMHVSRGAHSMLERYAVRAEAVSNHGGSVKLEVRGAIRPARRDERVPHVDAIALTP